METAITEVGMPLIAVLVPLIVSLIRRLIPKLPKWSLPILAAVAGPVTDQLLALIASTEAIGWQAAVLGLAGVGVREVVDQSRKALSPS